MNVWGAVAGGVVGTLVQTSTLRAAGEFGLTRIDLPFLLGTAVSRDRGRVKAIGYLLHFARTSPTARSSSVASSRSPDDSCVVDLRTVGSRSIKRILRPGDGECRVAAGRFTHSP